MKKIAIKINGQDIETAPGKTILEVVREQDLDDIPTLCYSPELEPYGSCFLCVVEVKGRGNLVPSCATRVAEGMEIETCNERVKASRKTALELLLSNHYADCVSPCNQGCPAGVDAQGYIALSAMGQYRRAVDLIRRSNPLPAVCGRVCVRKCEMVCRRGDVDAPVGINAIKRFVTDAPGIYDGQPQCDAPTGKTVGIIGAGPAGLTAAWFLGLKGHKATLYEAQSRSGGMLRYGIPTYRLPDDVIDAEVEYICRTGAEIKYNVSVGQDISLDEIRQKHDAVFIASGAWTGKAMRVEGEFDTEGVVTGTAFLQQMAQKPQAISGTVVVVGGGNTAMDVARSSWRLGADKVILMYRRTRNEMPADKMEIEDCLEEGIEIMELSAPVGIVKENGRIKSLQCIRMKLGEPDASGRRRPIPLEGSEFEQQCQMAVSAIGQAPILEGLRQISGQDVQITKRGTFQVDNETMKTNLEGVFAGGDAADDGPTVVIDAIRDGQKAARTLHAFLTDAELPKAPFAVSKEFWSKPGQTELGEIKETPRHEVHLIDVEDRKGNFDEVASGFEFEDNEHECERCLSCGCIRYADCALRLYAEQYGVDMEKYKGYVRKHKVDDRHPYLVYDPNKCVLCARCIRTCARILPISALGLVERGFKTEMRPALNDPLIETSCINCGNCVDACPTGALTLKYPFPGRASLFTDDEKTHCGFCSLACPITVKKFGADRYYIGSSGIPGDYLCRYGRFGHELFIKQKRITAPEIRSGSQRQQVEMDQARQTIVNGMKRVIEKYGPDQVAVFVSPELTNEELYLAGKIAREGLKTNNIASLSLLNTGKEAGVLDDSFGFTASTADRSCLDQADLIICNNTSLESDHLILAVQVIQAVKRGAKLIVSNSTLDSTDQHLSTLALDPMRGRAAVLWDGIIQVLLDEGFFAEDMVRQIPGGETFMAQRNHTLEDVSGLTGVDSANIRRAAEIIHQAKNIVVIHSPDRTQDQAPADLEVLANLVALCRGPGNPAHLLLPRINSNSAALEIMGADPAFGPGRVALNGQVAGAASHGEFQKLLSDGVLRAALIIGEDPMAWTKSGSWLGNIEFLAALDWTDTETTQYADVVLPGSTFLETEGTRCNFEGKVIRYAPAVAPPAGVSAREILGQLAADFGVETAPDTTAEIEAIMLSQLGDKCDYYWNTSGSRRSDTTSFRLVAVQTPVRSGSIAPPFTHGEKYKKQIKDVGADRFRVKY